MNLPDSYLTFKQLMLWMQCCLCFVTFDIAIAQGENNGKVEYYPNSQNYPYLQNNVQPQQYAPPSPNNSQQNRSRFNAPPSKNRMALKNEPAASKIQKTALNQKTIQLFLEPMGLTMNPLSLGPSITIGGVLSYYFYSSYSLDVTAYVPVFGASDFYSKQIYGAGFGKTFENGAILRIGMGYKLTSETRKYERAYDKANDDVLEPDLRPPFVNCPNKNGITDPNNPSLSNFNDCKVNIGASYIGIYSSVGMQLVETNQFGVHLRLFTLFYPLPIIGQSVTLDSRDKSQKGLFTPRDSYDVSTMGISASIGF